jgi:hypothetical protein
MDKRTQEGQEEIIIDYVKRNGGFTIFWVTANKKRAHAAMRLEQSGRLIKTRLGFPNFKATINENICKS